MKVAISVFIIFFSILSPDILSNMIQAVYIPEQIVKLNGNDSDGVKIVLNYDKKSDTLEKKHGEKTILNKSSEMDLFLKLFLFPGNHESPDGFIKVSDSLKELLKKHNIDIEKNTISALENEGAAVFSLGKEKRFKKANELTVYKESFLPASLTLDNETIIFSDYHKSVFPAAFPGRIEFYKDNKLIKFWSFYRKEFQQQISSDKKE